MMNGVVSLCQLLLQIKGDKLSKPLSLGLAWQPELGPEPALLAALLGPCSGQQATAPVGSCWGVC